MSCSSGIIASKKTSDVVNFLTPPAAFMSFSMITTPFQWNFGVQEPPYPLRGVWCQRLSANNGFSFKATFAPPYYNLRKIKSAKINCFGDSPQFERFRVTVGTSISPTELTVDRLNTFGEVLFTLPFSAGFIRNFDFAFSYKTVAVGSQAGVNIIEVEFW